MQLWTAVHDRLNTRCAVRQPMPSTRNEAVVLLVQPCDDGLLMYAEHLCEYGLAVIAVSEPWDALIAAPKADVIVTGILLAGSMDGVELIARLRRDERLDRRPIIVLTACAWNAERERARRAGCDLFLAKPCAPSDLLRHVRASLAVVALRRVRGKAAKSRPSDAPCVTLRGAADSIQRSTTQLRRHAAGDKQG